MSTENTVKTGTPLLEADFKISGDKIRLENRPNLKFTTLTQRQSRPSSAVPSLSLYNKEDNNSNMKSRRPYSADNLLYKSRLEDYNFVTTVEETTTCEAIEQENHLPSSQILKDLILEPIQSYRSRSDTINPQKAQQTNPFRESHILKPDSENRNHQSICTLTPGLISKPPLPKKPENKSKIKANTKDSDLIDNDEIEIIRLKTLKFEEDSIKKYQRNNLNNQVKFKIDEIKSERDFNTFLEQTQCEIEKNVDEKFIETYAYMEEINFSEVIELHGETVTNEQTDDDMKFPEMLTFKSNQAFSACKLNNDLNCGNYLSDDDDIPNIVLKPKTSNDILLKNTKKQCEEENNGGRSDIQEIVDNTKAFDCNNSANIENPNIIVQHDNVDLKFENFFREYSIVDTPSKKVSKNNNSKYNESKVNKHHIILKEKDKLNCINETRRNKLKLFKKSAHSSKDNIVTECCEEESWMSKSHSERKEECVKGRNNDATDFNSATVNSKNDDNNTKVNKWLRDECSTNTEDNDFLSVLENIEHIHVDGSVLHEPLLEMPLHTGGNTIEVSEHNTYNDIVQILKVLEAEDRKSHMKMETIQGMINQELHLQESNNAKHESEDLLNTKTTNIDVNSRTNSAISKSSDQGLGSTSSLNSSTSNYNQILSLLDDVDKSSSKTLTYAKERVQHVTKLVENAIRLDTIPKREDLVSLTTQELCDQIIELNLRLKDKSSSIKLLQEELSSVRGQVLKLTRQSESIVKQKLKVQKEEHEAIVKRHQKFIDQLINDKKVLNQQSESLICEIKSLEERYNSNMKAAEHKYQVELKKVKEMHTVGEKIRRERWIDNKTQKIKELTVKSLEPELQSITLRHQQEISDLRALHRNELEDLELKAARKTQQQCEAIREQMTEERVKALAQEKEIMQQRYEKLVESEEKTYQDQKRRLQQEYTNRLMEYEEQQNAVVSERDRAIKQAQEEFEDKLQTIIRRHNNEIKVLKETVTMEAEAWKTNYRKQQDLQLIEKEARMREQFKKERDREIEEVIDRLELEANETRMQTELATENKLRRIKEKYENEIRDVEESEKKAKAKYTESKSKLLECEDTIIGLTTNVKLLEMQLRESRDMMDKMSEEKIQLKEIVRKEMKQDLSTLEKEVTRLREEKDKELQQVYSRVKLAVAKKDEVLSELTRDHTALQEKCIYLENILDQQRKEYLIK